MFKPSIRPTTFKVTDMLGQEPIFRRFSCQSCSSQCLQIKTRTPDVLKEYELYLKVQTDNNKWIKQKRCAKRKTQVKAKYVSIQCVEFSEVHTHTHGNIHTELQLSPDDFSVEYSGGVKGYRLSRQHRFHTWVSFAVTEEEPIWTSPGRGKAEPLFRDRSTSTDESMMCMWKVKNRMWNELDILCCTSCKAAGAKWSSDVQGQEAKLQIQRKN